MKKLNVKIIILFITTIVFMQLNTSYYIKNEISKLSNELHKENAELSERIDEQGAQLEVYGGLTSESIQRAENIEGAIDDIDQKIYNIIEGYSNSYSDWYDIYYGRLYIPEANISVALYEDDAQFITDRADSANIIFLGDSNDYTIADHSNQEFSKLFKINIGTYGYIILKNGNVVSLKCVDIFNGHNNGVRIADENGVNADNRADYMTYTCMDNWRNVRICLWEII